MKYLKYREDFLHKEHKLDKTKIREQIKSSQMISEAFENDITWGGSLLGRLVNSIIRKGKVMVSATRINSLTKQLKTELDSLIPDVQLSSNEDIRMEVDQIKVKFLITEIYSVVQSDKTVAEKKGELVGDGSDDAGLIQVTIGEIEKISDEQLPEKQELIDKLKRFREALLKLNVVSQPVDDADDDDDDSEQNFYDQTINLLKSVIQLSNDISTKKVTVTKVEVGKEYTDKNGKVCMVISLDHEVERPSKKDGGDGMFFTNDDKIGKKLDSSLVSVIYRDDATKSYLGSSQLQRVKRLDLKIYDGKDTVKDKKSGKILQNVNASFFYRNELLPIFEADIKDNESHARASWNKVLTTWNKTGIANLVPKIKELIKGSESGTNAELYKKTIMKLGKQVIANKLTVGANPLKFEELIKEADTAYNDIPKAISLISRIILSFKEDMGLLSAIGDAGKTLKSFITAFGEMDKIYPKLKSKNVESKKEETTEAKNDSKLLNYSKFLRINEADDETPQPEEETDGENGDENESNSSDEVKEEWFKEFKEGEESEWKIDEKEAKDLQKKTDELENKPIEVNADDYYDHIIRIIRIFGKAYDLYATDVIPSGRPAGRISQKTFREYEYIGDSSSSSSTSWSEDKGPEGGPWAAKLPYNKWQDGVMQILENSKYRKILANIKFTSTAESSTDTKATKGSGKTLFTFMNDLLNGMGRFSKVRSKVMSEYFNSEDNKNKADDEVYGQGNKDPRVLEGDPGVAQFTKSSTGFFKKENFKKDLGVYKNSFLKISAKVEGESKQFIIFVVNYVTEQNPNHIVIKFHQQSKGTTVNQSIISKFLKNRLSTTNEAVMTTKDAGGKLKLDTSNIKFKENEPVFFGIVDATGKIFEKNKKTKIKYCQDPKNEDPKEMEIEVTNTEELTYYDKEKNIVINITNDKIKDYPTGDKSKGQLKIPDDKLSKWGLSKK